MTTPTERAARALELFDQLVDLQADECALRLAALRAIDSVLATEVSRMLQADAAGDGVIDLGLPAMAATVAGELAARAAEAEGESGRRVGPFILGRLLGRGGMGEVWLAQRADGDFRQQVALKLLTRGMDSADMLRRFAQERRILADLSHANIARFIDGGVSEDGTSWYAMEYVDGQPITDYVRSQSLALRARVVLIADVAEAVAYAQNRLVVHRDLKPSNIMVDAGARVHLLDFGIAKLLAGDTQPSETATGSRAMSPAYAAPEQVLGVTPIRCGGSQSVTSIRSTSVIGPTLVSHRNCVPTPRVCDPTNRIATASTIQSTCRSIGSTRHHTSSTVALISMST